MSKQSESGYFKKYYQEHKEMYSQRVKDGYHKKYREENKDSIKKYNKERNITDKEEYRNYHLKRTYNITLEEYNTLFIKQNGCCAICGKHQNELKNKLSVDHNHTTKKVRGLLCHKCNVALGYADENIHILLNMVYYLKKEIEALNSSNNNN